MSEEYPKEVKAYQLLNPIDKTQNATTFIAYCTKTGSNVTIKRVKLESVKSEVEWSRLNNDIAVLSKMNHDNVARSLCTFQASSKREPEHNSEHSEPEPELWVVTEPVAGTSSTAVRRINKASSRPRHEFGLIPFNEEVLAIILRDVLLGLSYLHQQNRIHRDLKASNVLIGIDGRAKLSGFSASTLSSTPRSFAGSPHWVAPEVWSDPSEGCSAQADIWSFGITCIELAYGSTPYSDVREPEELRKLVVDDELPISLLPSDCPKHFRELVKACLQKEPRSRPSSKQLLKAKFFSKVAEKEKAANIIKECVVKVMSRPLRDAAVQFDMSRDLGETKVERHGQRPDMEFEEHVSRSSIDKGVVSPQSAPVKRKHKTRKGHHRTHSHSGQSDRSDEQLFAEPQNKRSGSHSRAKSESALQHSKKGSVKKGRFIIEPIEQHEDAETRFKDIFDEPTKLSRKSPGLKRNDSSQKPKPRKTRSPVQSSRFTLENSTSSPNSSPQRGVKKSRFTVEEDDDDQVPPLDRAHTSPVTRRKHASSPKQQRTRKRSSLSPREVSSSPERRNIDPGPVVVPHTNSIQVVTRDHRTLSFELSDQSAPNSPLHKNSSLDICNVIQWSTKEVQGWLLSLGKDYESYCRAFEASGVDGEMLLEIDQEMLEELTVIKSIHRMKIMKCIKKLKPLQQSNS